VFAGALPLLDCFNKFADSLSICLTNSTVQRLPFSPNKSPTFSVAISQAKGTSAESLLCVIAIMLHRHPMALAVAVSTLATVTFYPAPN